MIRISEHDNDASNDSLGICPFQKIKCTGRKCHLWIGKLDESGNVSVGNCVFIKTLNEQKHMAQYLDWVAAILVLSVIIIIIAVVIGATIS